MKRKLSEKIQWDMESEKLELLDWETNPHDFDILCDFILRKLEAWVLPHGVKIEALMGLDELRAEIRRNAASFDEEFISLPLHVYLKTKIFVAEKARTRKRPTRRSNQP